MICVIETRYGATIVERETNGYERPVASWDYESALWRPLPFITRKQRRMVAATNTRGNHLCYNCKGLQMVKIHTGELIPCPTCGATGTTDKKQRDMFAP